MKYKIIYFNDSMGGWDEVRDHEFSTWEEAAVFIENNRYTLGTEFSRACRDCAPGYGNTQIIPKE